MQGRLSAVECFLVCEFQPHPSPNCEIEGNRVTALEIQEEFKNHQLTVARATLVINGIIVRKFYTLVTSGATNEMDFIFNCNGNYVIWH